MTKNMEAANPSTENSVVERIIDAFIAAVSIEEGFEVISQRLKSKLIEEKDHSDSAIETALFGIAES